MKLLRGVAVALVMAAALFFAIGYVLPDKAHVTRSILVAAPQCQVFAVLDGFRLYDQWSPWAGRDPQRQAQIGGAPFGVGARYDWSGGEAAGSGSLVIVDSAPYKLVKVKAQYGDRNQPTFFTFTLQPQGAQTLVTWTADIGLGPDPLAHYLGLMVDKKVGPEYEQGLQRLKTLAESRPKDDFSALNVDLTDVKAQTYLYLPGRSSTDPEAVNKAQTEAFGKLGEVMKELGLKQTGAPLAVTKVWDPLAKVYEFDAGIPIERTNVTLPPKSEADFAQTYAGPALRVRYKGSYRDLPQTYALLTEFMKAFSLRNNGLLWEQYLTDPTATPEAQRELEIFVPVK
jgi:hypothetical protein